MTTTPLIQTFLNHPDIDLTLVDEEGKTVLDYARSRFRGKVYHVFKSQFNAIDNGNYSLDFDKNEQDTTDNVLSSDNHIVQSNNEKSSLFLERIMINKGALNWFQEQCTEIANMISSTCEQTFCACCEHSEDLTEISYIPLQQ